MTNQADPDSADGNDVRTTSTFTFEGDDRFLGFRDVSQSFFDRSGSSDGFDIASIDVSQVPLPTAGLLLLVGLGALGAMRGRRKAA